MSFHYSKSLKDSSMCENDDDYIVGYCIGSFLYTYFYDFCFYCFLLILFTILRILELQNRVRTINVVLVSKFEHVRKYIARMCDVLLYNMCIYLCTHV